MNISITNKDGLVLETAHEICKENIIIEPVLQDINITRNGKYLPGDGYAGIGRAFIEIPDSAIPTEVATEEEMTAILSSGNVGGVYKYVGETGEVYANGEMYVLETLPDALAGTWVFNDTIDITDYFFPNPDHLGDYNYYFYLNFNSNSLDFNYFRIGGSRAEGIWQDFGMGYIGDSNNPVAYANGAWRDEVYKTIEITSTYEESVSLNDETKASTFLTWLQANATKQ